MTDDDDVMWAVILGPDGARWWISLIFIAILIGLWVVVSNNHAECAKMQCEKGQPVLMKHECLCVEKAVAPNDALPAIL